jgi:hypothetical protein
MREVENDEETFTRYKQWAIILLQAASVPGYVHAYDRPLDIFRGNAHFHVIVC